jgi:serine protease Do
VLEVVKNLVPSPISLETMGLAFEERSGDSKELLKVSHVEKDSSASKAGLISGDRIESVDNQVIRSSFDLERAFWGRKFGDRLKLKIYGKPTIISLGIESAAGKQLTHAELVWSRLGIWALEVPASRVKHINPEYKGGLLVVNVAPESFAEKAGLLPGDIILGVLTNGEGFSTVEAANFSFMMRDEKFPKNTYVDLLFMRDGDLAPQVKMYLPADR